jgi:hypothetical protein
MLKNVFIITVVLVLTAGVAWAGDFDFDVMLKEINIEAEADIGGYKARLAADFGTSEKTISLMLEKENMKPGDAYMALKISDVAKVPVETVITEFKNNRDKGWGVIAKNLGIKPGSAEFHALKAKGGGGGAKAKKGKGKKKK